MIFNFISNNLMKYISYHPQYFHHILQYQSPSYRNYNHARPKSQPHIQYSPSVDFVIKVVNDLNHMKKKLSKFDQFCQYYNIKKKDQKRKENSPKVSREQLIKLQKKLLKCEEELKKQKEQKQKLKQELQQQYQFKKSRRQVGKFTKVLSKHSIRSRGSNDSQKSFEQSQVKNNRQQYFIIDKPNKNNKNSPYLIKSHFQKQQNQLQKLIQKFDELSTLQKVLITQDRSKQIISKKNEKQGKN